jgi:hypothetical protein
MPKQKVRGEPRYVLGSMVGTTTLHNLSDHPTRESDIPGAIAVSTAARPGDDHAPHDASAADAVIVLHLARRIPILLLYTA